METIHARFPGDWARVRDGKKGYRYGIGAVRQSDSQDGIFQPATMTFVAGLPERLRAHVREGVAQRLLDRLYQTDVLAKEGVCSGDAHQVVFQNALLMLSQYPEPTAETMDALLQRNTFRVSNTECYRQPPPVMAIRIPDPWRALEATGLRPLLRPLLEARGCRSDRELGERYTFSDLLGMVDYKNAACRALLTEQRAAFRGLAKDENAACAPGCLRLR